MPVTTRDIRKAMNEARDGQGHGPLGTCTIEAGGLRKTLDGMTMIACYAAAKSLDTVPSEPAKASWRKAEA